MTKFRGKKDNLSKPFFSINDNIIGENFKSKIKKIKNFLRKNKSDWIFISAPENVAWLLNIRGHDNPNSPIPNCSLLMSNNTIYLITKRKNQNNLIKRKKIKSKQIIETKNFKTLINKIRGKKLLLILKLVHIFMKIFFLKNLRF